MDYSVTHQHAGHPNGAVVKDVDMIERILPADVSQEVDEGGTVTDKEALLKLLKRFNLEPESDADGRLTLEAKCGNVKGYYGFMASFTFDDNGKFIDLDIYE